MAGATVSKKAKNRKALKPLTANDVNISAAMSSAKRAAAKGNNDNLYFLLPKKSNTTSNLNENSFAQELQELQGRIELLRLEKEKTEELLKERDELLRQKDEELENRGKKQQKLQQELKKLQKLKEFKPTMSFPLVKSLRDKEQGKEEDKKKKKKKNGGGKKKKKPSPPYVLWCKEYWNEVKKENPDADFKEISNIIGTKWKNLSAEEKQPYEEKYQQEKGVYLLIVGQEKRENEAMKLLEEEQMQKTAKELLEQYLQFRQEADKDGKKAKKEKDPLKPKQPMPAFFLYSKERRGALLAEKRNILEIAKIAGEEWKNMNEEQKAPYEEIARKHKEEHTREMEIYRQKKVDEAEKLEKDEGEQRKILKQEALQLLKKKEKTENIIKKTKETRQKKKLQKGEPDPNKPKRPASSFLLFSKEARKQLSEERPGITNSSLNALISVKWKEMSDAEKQVWNEKAAEGMAAYKREMEEYKKMGAAVASKLC